MKRLVLVPLAVFGLALPATPAAAASHTRAKLSRCHSSLDAFQRSFDLAAGMRTYKRVKRMAIRFDVFEKRPGGKYAAIKSSGYGTWIRESRPHHRTFTYLRTVNNLDAPATYRVRVGFRWYGKHGKVRKTSYRVTRACHQVDLRPDLRIRSVTVLAGKKGKNRYAVVVRNAGHTRAGAFTLRMSFPGGGLASFDFLGLAPGKTARHVFNGQPECSAGAPTVTVDAGAVVDESNEANNARLVTCPAS